MKSICCWIKIGNRCFNVIPIIIMLMMLLPFSNIYAQKRPYIRDGRTFNQNKWELVFSDEFRKETTIDKHWMPENMSPSGILSSRWRDNLHVKWGKLRIQNKKEKKGGREWTSGSMYSRPCYAYGFYECRMRISKASGVNNSFWITVGKKPEKHAFEIDFVEAHYPNVINMTIHDWGAEGKERLPSVSHTYKPDVDLSAGYHTYGCNWEEDKISFYFDGELIWETDNQFCDHAGPMVLGTAILGWAGKTTDAIDGTDMRVDYVRVWTKQ